MSMIILHVSSVLWFLLRPLLIYPYNLAQMGQPNREAENHAKAQGSSAASCHSTLQWGGIMLGSHSIHTGIAAACCLHRSAGGEAAHRCVHLGASAMLVKKKTDEKNKRNWGSGRSSEQAGDFLPVMSRCIRVSEHVWMSSIPGKAESVKRSWVKREWEGGLAPNTL